MGLTDRIFTDPAASGKFPVGPGFRPGHDVASIKTYRYLRLGMLAAVAALTYSILEARFAHGVNCFLGSISGYYYTPVRTVFVGVMVAIGLALLVIKGTTVIEDACLSLAGVLAPVVAFIPTSDNPGDACRRVMITYGQYLPPATDGRVAASSISNDLHAYLFAGTAAVALLLLAAFLQWRRSARFGTTTMAEYTAGTWWSLLAAVVVVVIGWFFVVFDYKLVLQGHAWSALGMFLFLAIAALADGILGIQKGYTQIRFAVIYIIVGSLMLVSGAVFVVFRSVDSSAFQGHLVLCIEIVELALFAAFWALQTVERWNFTV